MSQRFSLNVNGKNHNGDVDPHMPLLYALPNESDLSPRRSPTGSSTQPACAFAGCRSHPTA